MNVSEEWKRDFTEECLRQTLEFDSCDQYKLQNLIREGVSQEEAIKKIQKFISSALNELVYATNGSKSLANAMKEINENIRLKIGLISIVDVSKYWTENKGVIRYYFYLGQHGDWSRYFSNNNYPNNWNDIKQKHLPSGVDIGTRIFEGKNTSGALLSNSRQDVVPDNCKVMIVGNPSEDGLSKSADKPLWALVEPKDFPQIYAIVSREMHPIGFFQLSTNLNQVDGYTFNPNSQFIDREGDLHIYKPKLPWVASIREVTGILCTHFILHVLGRAYEVIQHHKYLADRQRFFPDTFLNAVKLGKSSNSNTYSKSKWHNSLNEIRECLLQGRFEPAELALGIISKYWEDSEELKGLKINQRIEAENTLFWIQNYREHFVHTLKVFLIGQCIINDIYDNRCFSEQQKQIDKLYGNRGNFEQLWMLTSTVHDWACPIEKLHQLQKIYWNKFLLGDITGFELDEASTSMLNIQTTHMFADRAVCTHTISDFLQLLQFDMWPPCTEIVQAYNIYEQKVRNLLFSESLRHLIQNRDHGAASALWFLSRVFKLSNEKKLKLKVPEYFGVAHAVFFHNIAMAKDKKTDKFPGLNFSFKRWPLTCLLLLSDVLQDEGRPESKETKRRPISFLKKIYTENDTIKIVVEYKWARNKTGASLSEPVLLLSHKCQEYSDKWDKGCLSGSGRLSCSRLKALNCPHCNDISGHLNNLYEKISGLPFFISVEQEAETFGIGNNSGI